MTVLASLVSGFRSCFQPLFHSMKAAPPQLGVNSRLEEVAPLLSKPIRMGGRLLLQLLLSLGVLVIVLLFLVLVFVVVVSSQRKRPIHHGWSKMLLSHFCLIPAEPKNMKLTTRTGAYSLIT